MKEFKELKEKVNEEEIKQLKLQDKFYADGYTVWQKIVLVQAVIIAVLFLSFGLYFLKNRPKTFFFATSNEEKLLKIAPLSEPFVEKSALLNFTVKAFNESTVFGFYDYRSKFSKTKKYFTEKGWASFNKFLEDNQYIETITNERKVVYSTPQFPPLIKKREIQNGVYKWYIEMPVSIYTSALSQVGNNNIMTKNFLLKLEVVRAYQENHPEGIAIDNWEEAPISQE